MAIASSCVWLAAGCDKLFSLTTAELPAYADDDHTDDGIDAYIGADADISGWPVNGGVAPRDCAGLTGDEDADTKANGCDNCPLDYNPGQADGDVDGVGDVCDPHPQHAVDALAYFSTFNGAISNEGARAGTSGTYVVENGLLRQTATTQGRTLFVIAGGPWRTPVVELKIGTVSFNGPNDDDSHYAGLYILQAPNPVAASPRPDSIHCNARYGNIPRYRVVRTRNDVEVTKDAADLVVGARTTLVCGAGHLGEPPSVAAAGTDVAPAALSNWLTLAPDASDVEESRIGLWTYYARADFESIAIYETIWPQR